MGELDVDGESVERNERVVIVPALPPNANRPGWRDLLSVLAIVWYSVVVMLISLTAFWVLFYGDDEYLLEGPEEMLLDVVLAAIGVIAAWVFASMRQGRSFADGFYIVPIDVKAYAMSLLAGLGCAAVALAITSRLAAGPSDLAGYLIEPLSGGLDGSRVRFFVIVIALPLCLCSEIFYRGFVFPVLRRAAGPIWGGCLTVLLATSHWIIMIPDERNFFDPIYIATIGVVFTWMRHRYDSLLPCLVARGAGEMAYTVWLIATVYHANN